LDDLAEFANSSFLDLLDLDLLDFDVEVDSTLDSEFDAELDAELDAGLDDWAQFFDPQT